MSAIATLDTIRQTVRKITGTPKGTSVESQISDADIDFYINTYYIYDMPEELRLFTLTSNFTFFTEPNVDTYDFPRERFNALSKPIYVAGYDQGYYQDQEVFFGIWPKVQFFQTVGVGNGMDTSPFLANFTSTPVLSNCVSVCTKIGSESICLLDDGNGNFLNDPFKITGITKDNEAIITVPGNNFISGENIFIRNVFGMTQINGGPYSILSVLGDDIKISVNSTNFSSYISGGGATSVKGTINYLTGEISINWGGIPNTGQDIDAQYVSYAASRPRDCLFFDNKMTFRPVPDKAYKVECQVERVPTELLNDPEVPELRQWWQLLALGASLKFFRDNADFEQHEKFYPFYDQQLTLVLHRTLNQLKNQKVLTPYDDQSIRNHGIFNDFSGAG